MACLVTQDAGPSKPGGSAPKVSYADKWVCIIIIICILVIVLIIVMCFIKDNGPKPGGSAPRTSHYDDRTSHYDDSWVCK